LRDTVLGLCGLAWEARILAGTGAAVAFGNDRNRLAAELGRARANGCKGILSFGTAAGLAPELLAGDLILAERVVGPTDDWPCDDGWVEQLRSCLPDAIVGGLAGVSHALVDATAKGALYASSGALAADMESGFAAQYAHAHGMRFAAVRAIIDTAAQRVPQSALAALRPDGTTDVAALCQALIRRPSELIDILRLAHDAARARRSLLNCAKRIGEQLCLPTP